MNNIILIGMPLSGKSTLGRELSKILNRELIDTDRVIEKIEGKSIEKMFKIHGEDYFRQKELEIIDKLKKEKNKIISTGGGLPIYNENIYKLKNIGFTVYLKVTLEELIKRVIKKEKRTRPLLKNNNGNFLEEMYKERIEIYEKADNIVYNNNKEESIKSIIMAYEEWQKIDKK